MEWLVLVMAIIGSFMGSFFAQLVLQQKNRTTDLPMFTPKVDVAKAARASSPDFRARRIRESEGPEHRPGE